MHNPTNRVLQILNLFINNKKLNFSQISTLTDIPKGTLSPILNELIEKSYLNRSKTMGFYTLGLQTFRLGVEFLNQNNLLEFIKVHMQEIVRQCGETCQFGILEAGNVLYLQKVESQNSIRLFSFVGKQLPAYATAIGKALLSDKDEKELQNLYPKNLETFTKNTIKTRDILLKELQEIAKSGIATENGGYTEDIRCVAVPIKNYENKVIAAISVSFPAFRIDDKKYDFIIEVLKKELLKIQNEIKFLNHDFRF